jgi:anti-sigma factor RsiW
LLTCKEFLAELSDFLDEDTDAAIKAKLENHIAQCPNCFVICDTTKKTISVYKGMKSCTIPEDVHDRLMAAVERRIAAKKVPSTTEA